MADDQKGKGPPRPINKLNPLPKKSLFERQKAEAEAKREREAAENAAALEEFVKSFEDDTETRPSDLRAHTHGPGRGGFGGGPKRHFTNSGPRRSGPGTLGPPPPSLARKKPHEGFTRNRDSAPGALGLNQGATGLSGPRAAFRNASDDEEEQSSDAKEAERAVPKPAVQLSSLPPGTSLSVVKSLIPSSLIVDNVNMIRPTPQHTTERASMAAIVTFASDTPASAIDSAERTRPGRPLPLAYQQAAHYPLEQRKYSQTMLSPNELRRQVLIVGGIAPPNPSVSNASGGDPALVEVKIPSDIKQLRLIHMTIEKLITNGPEFEALLMSRPEVIMDEKWAWLFNPRSPGGVYYRWKFFEIVTNHDPLDKEPVAIFEEGPRWKPPANHLKFEWVTRLEEFVSDDDYDSSDEEDLNDEAEKRNLGGGPPPEGAGGQEDDVNYMGPLKKAKLTHLLARLPTTNTKLRNGDIARVTAFAMDNAAAGAEEVVDMIIQNILTPFAYTEANPNHKAEIAAIKSENVDSEKANTTEAIDVSPAKLVAVYAMSDILGASAGSGVRHAWRYRQMFESALRSRKVFEHLGSLEKDLKWGRLRAEKWKRSMNALFDIWELWSAFQMPNQRHFKDVFDQPALLEEEESKMEQDKAEADRAAAAFSKSRWKVVENEPDSRNLDSSKPSQSEFVGGVDNMEDEIMSDIDGVPMVDSDLEDPVVEGDPMEEDSPQQEVTNTKEPSPAKLGNPEKEETTIRRPRHPRPKAQDMFASDSE
ncbi:coatamer subunit protein [Penicillium chermesinum]|uniref:Coatamer subunit protein n=1 Tax=Penicillium chermesinum TaxID=63820 RepID=A0A9W9P8H7_9EURO|nr:coatamer subunit protein [Penicillium chermesinum]KAJ5239810.1 coatamer subunit protein [Penicillium chermesinum]